MKLGCGIFYWREGIEAVGQCHLRQRVAPLVKIRQIHPLTQVVLTYFAFIDASASRRLRASAASELLG
jgi:hypothetical protein